MTELHLVRFLFDKRAFIRLAAHKGADESYVLHAGLAALFGTPEAPAQIPLLNFAHDDTREAQWEWDMRDRALPVIAYAECDAETLRAQVSKPEVLVELEARKKTGLVAGSTHLFRLRACPTVRTRRDRNGKPAGRNAGRELDAYQHARIADPEVPRDIAYMQWLQQKLDGAATLQGARLESHQSQHMTRKGKGKTQRIALPNAVLTGRLQIQDESAFEAVIRRGIGRHRTFGFGMLLVRRA